MPSVLSDLFGSDRIARLQAITSAFGALPVLVMPPLAGKCLIGQRINNGAVKSM